VTLLASIIQILTSRYVTLAALIALSLVGAVLFATSVSAARTEAQLRGRIAELTRINARQGAYWNAKLSACQAGKAGGAEKVADVSPEGRARRLAASGPAGFDVCARMESADRAVLETLR
jgi:hypothetical protein